MSRSHLSAALLAALASCWSPPEPPAPASRPFDVWVGDHLATTSAERALLAERSLYEHHFEPGSARLSPLGERDLAVLAAHLADSGGEIAVRAPFAARALHEARLETVRHALVDLGVPREGVRLTDEPPGGTGISSARLVAIQAREAAAVATPAPAPTLGGSPR